MASRPNFMWVVHEPWRREAVDALRRSAMRAAERPPGSLFSMPAAELFGMVASVVAAQAGEKTVMSFDMGGTTAKICLLDDGTPTRSRKGTGGVITTRAKGEGGIEGTAEMYRVRKPFDTDFAFSRFGSERPARPRVMPHKL